jgi:hypothetical protein
MKGKCLFATVTAVVTMIAAADNGRHVLGDRDKTGTSEGWQSTLSSQVSTDSAFTTTGSFAVETLGVERSR